MPSLCVMLNFSLCRFLDLNTDALQQIFAYLWPDGDLLLLSMTCWPMRQAAMLVLFNCCTIHIKEPINEEHFMPRSLWPYVR